MVRFFSLYVALTIRQEETIGRRNLPMRCDVWTIPSPYSFDGHLFSKTARPQAAPSFMKNDTDPCRSMRSKAKILVYAVYRLHAPTG